MKDKVSRSIILALPILFLVFFFLIPLLFISLLALGLTPEDLLGILTHDLNLYFIYWDLQQAFLTVILCLILGLPGSYFLAHTKLKGKSIIRNLLTIPFILPPIVVLMGFIEVFGQGGLVNQIWYSLTGFQLVQIYNSYEGIILAHVFYNLPVIIRLAEIGWRTINPEMIGVAKSLGVSRIKILLKIQLPHLFPILATASLLVFIYAFNSFAIVLVLGGVQYQTLEVRIYSLAKMRFDFNAAAALTLVQIMINIIVILTYLYFSSKYEIPSDEVQEFQEKSLIINPINIRNLTKLSIIGIYFSIITILSLLPIVGVFWSALNSSLHLISFENFFSLFDRSLISFIGVTPVEMISNSLFFGICVLLLSTFLAVMLNFGLNYDKTATDHSKFTLLGSVSGIIIILPLGISSITLAFSLFSLYRLTPLYENIFIAIIIAQTLVAFPFVNRIIAARRASIDPSLIHVARSLGASRFRTFFRIELPLLLPGIIVAGLFSFAISLGEFGATNFLARANFATIPIGIYKLINTRNLGEAAALATILIIITVISFIVLEKFGKIEFKL